MWDASHGVKRFIARDKCLELGQTIQSGLTNHCVIKGYHLMLDADKTPLRDVIEAIVGMQHVTKAPFYITISSPFNFHITCFKRMSWNEYIHLLLASGICHKEYIYCITLKGYAVLRTGAKNGIVPSVMYKIAGDDRCECKVCKQQYFDSIAFYQKQLTEVITI